MTERRHRAAVGLWSTRAQYKWAVMLCRLADLACRPRPETPELFVAEIKALRKRAKTYPRSDL